MSRRRDDDVTLGTLGAAAIGGPVLAGASALGGLLGEGERRSKDLGPAPIGSDPWLRAEVRAAIARVKGQAALGVTVDARDAVVTLAGEADEDDVPAIVEAARSVLGIRRLEVDLDVDDDEAG